MILVEDLHPVGWGLGGGLIIGMAGAAMLRIGGFDLTGCLLAMATLVPAGIAACYILGDARMETVFNSAQTTLISGLFFPLSANVIKRLPFLRSASGDAETGLVEGMEEVAARCLDAAAQIVNQLLDDLGGPTEAGLKGPQGNGGHTPSVTG